MEVLIAVMAATFVLGLLVARERSRSVEREICVLEARLDETAADLDFWRRSCWKATTRREYPAPVRTRTAAAPVRRYRSITASPRPAQPVVAMQQPKVHQLPVRGRRPAVRRRPVDPNLACLPLPGLALAGEQAERRRAA